LRRAHLPAYLRCFLPFTPGVHHCSTVLPNFIPGFVYRYISVRWVTYHHHRTTICYLPFFITITDFLPHYHLPLDDSAVTCHFTIPFGLILRSTTTTYATPHRLHHHNTFHLAVHLPHWASAPRSPSIQYTVTLPFVHATTWCSLFCRSTTTPHRCLLHCVLTYFHTVLDHFTATF